MTTQSSAEATADCSAEWRFLLACARTVFDDAQREKIRALLGERIDWVALARLAARHHVDPLLCKELGQEFATELPADVAEKLKETARGRAQWALRLTGQMFRVIELLERGGVRAIPYKGPVLASMAFGNIALRSFEDLDFVLAQEDVPRAFSLLVGAGFRTSIDATNPGHRRFLRRGDLGQYLFLAPNEPIMVELHTEKTLRYFPVPLRWEGLRARQEIVIVCGRKAPSFSAEDLLVMLSVHGTKHFWNRLSWICDIAELVRSRGNLDWELSERIAREIGCHRMWLLGLLLAHEQLDAALPEMVLRQLAPSHDLDVLRSGISQALHNEAGTEPLLGERLRFRMRAHESKSNGLRQCVRMATRITEEDWETLSLPLWATPLYIALRPWRLASKYGLGARRKMPAKAETSTNHAPSASGGGAGQTR